jgi:translation initiation factor IF-1
LIYKGDIQTVAKEEGLRMDGVVVDVLPNTMFRVSINGNDTVIGYISGKMRKNEIRILLGDTVEMEFSPYDLTKGRIVKRL